MRKIVIWVCICGFYAFCVCIIKRKEPCEIYRKALLVVYDRVVRISPD